MYEWSRKKLTDSDDSGEGKCHTEDTEDKNFILDTRKSCSFEVPNSEENLFHFAGVTEEVVDNLFLSNFLWKTTGSSDLHNQAWLLFMI